MSEQPERLSIFCPIFKVDDEKSEVSGYIAEEAPDRTGEILDYDKSKPYFQEWSESQKAASGGKSLGNVRLMHGKTAIGRVINIDFDDASKRIHVVSHITNKDAFNDAKSGVLTGYSVGGSYVSREPEADGKLLRYVARPQEVSLVDRPAMVGATFTMVKADGSEEVRKFVGRKVTQVWFCGVTAHTHMTKADALACECEVDETPTITVKVDTSQATAALDGLTKRIGAERLKKAGPELRKSLYDVGDLAACLMTLNRIRLNAEAEAAYEGDGSSMPSALADEVVHLGELLVQMCEEETGELVADAGDEPTAVAAVEPGTNPSPDLTNLPGLTVQYGTWARADVEKLLARIPKAHRTRGVELLKRAADALETLGDTAQEEPVMDEATLTKLFGAQTEAISKSFDEKLKPIADRLEKAEKETAELKAKIESAPAPTKVVLHAVGKGADTGAEVDDELTKDAPLGPYATKHDQERHRLMKASMRKVFNVPASAMGGSGR